MAESKCGRYSIWDRIYYGRLSIGSKNKLVQRNNPDFFYKMHKMCGHVCAYMNMHQAAGKNDMRKCYRQNIFDTVKVCKN